jgi:hypothetical protein
MGKGAKFFPNSKGGAFVVGDSKDYQDGCEKIEEEDENRSSAVTGRNASSSDPFGSKNSAKNVHLEMGGKVETEKGG